MTENENLSIKHGVYYQGKVLSVKKDERGVFVVDFSMTDGYYHWVDSRPYYGYTNKRKVLSQARRDVKNWYNPLAIPADEWARMTGEKELNGKLIENERIV